MQIDIRDLRLRLGDISQAELGELLGVDQSTVSRLEARGEVDGPIGKLLQRLDEETPRTRSVEAAE